MTTKNLDKAQVIKEIVRLYKRNGFDNKKDWLYINKIARNKLDLKGFRAEKKLPVYLTLEEVRTLLNVAYGLQNENQTKIRGLILETLVKTGLRNFELCNLRIENIDFKTGIFKIIKGKGSKDRMGIIPNSLLKLLDFYIGQRKSGFLFISARGTEFTTRRIQQIVKQIREIAEIQKDITPHTLRHSYATLLLEWGVDIRKIQELLGHENLETTQIYTFVDVKKLQPEVKLLDNI